MDEEVEKRGKEFKVNYALIFWRSLCLTLSAEHMYEATYTLLLSP